jgi:hypothetical protein
MSLRSCDLESVMLSLLPSYLRTILLGGSFRIRREGTVRKSSESVVDTLSASLEDPVSMASEEDSGSCGRSLPECERSWSKASAKTGESCFEAEEFPFTVLLRGVGLRPAMESRPLRANSKDLAKSTIALLVS